MPLVEIIQAGIHKLELGSGQRYLRYAIVVLVVLLVGLRYDFHDYKNLSTPEGMDSAQLARNIADGDGYTTQFIRPLSLYLVQKHDQAAKNSAANTDPARIKTAHPDIANPPVYPVLLAGLMKILPFHYDIPTGNDEKFSIYQPDLLIAIFNQILLLIVAVMTFFIARKLFDAPVAWLSAVLVFFGELFWRFSVSGLSTMLLLIIFLGLAWCVLKIEECARETEQTEQKEKSNRLLALAVFAGALVGVGALTRYSFAWLIIPTALFLFFFSGRRRLLHALAAFGAFAILLMPWIVRNCVVSGAPFGTAGYAVVEGTYLFPHFELQRSIHPDLTSTYSIAPYAHKLADGIQRIFEKGLLNLGDCWASMFFLAGLLLPFRNVAVRRARYFLLMCLGIFIVVQSLGQTGLSDQSPKINSENLLVLLAPLVFVFGVSLFFTLLDQMTLPEIQLRYAVVGIFTIVCCLPMIFALGPGRNSPLAYPPYYPPEIQKIAGWMKPDEMMMSDVPWAVAWYGNRQCVWLTDNSQDSFNAINHNLKAVSGIYFTTETLNQKFLSDMARDRSDGWGRFVLKAGTDGKFPPGFYLQTLKVLGSGLFITDHQRWPNSKLAEQ